MELLNGKRVGFIPPFTPKSIMLLICFLLSVSTRNAISLGSSEGKNFQNWSIIWNSTSLLWGPQSTKLCWIYGILLSIELMNRLWLQHWGTMIGVKTKRQRDKDKKVVRTLIFLRYIRLFDCLLMFLEKQLQKVYAHWI